MNGPASQPAVPTPAVDAASSISFAYLSGAPRISTATDAAAHGPRTHILGVVNALRDQGHRVSTFIAGDQLPARFTGRASESMAPSSQLRAFVADVLRLLLGAINGFRARRACLEGCQVVYERLSLFSALGRGFQRRGIPWVVETNGILSREFKEGRGASVLTRLARKMEMRVYRDCDLVVCVSEPLADSVRREATISAEKVIVIPNGVDIRAFGDVAHPTRTATFTIGFVGHVVAWQGLDLLLKAIARLRANGMDLNLTVVGDGPVKNELKSLASSLGLAQAVHWLGTISPETVPSLLAGFDLGFCGDVGLSNGAPYRSPLKLYEYMASATPPVVVASHESRGLVEDGRTGFLFESNIESLELVLARAFAERDMLPTIGARARHEVARNHTWFQRTSSLVVRVRELLTVEHAGLAGATRHEVALR